ncbi:MAG: F0F1 ATP synthase subunit gamma [Pirellulales bacterium]|nr:F0F1 ATP synthase subunit gamma [Pirellulales bacterium]
MTFEQTQRRRQVIATIHDIVGAMRAIAAGRIQSAQRALASSRRYEDVVLRAILALTEGLDSCPFREVLGTPALLVVMTSEQPLCGTFNQAVLSLADRRFHELREKGDVRLMVVGHRGLRQLAMHGMVSDAAEAAATSVHGLRDVVKRLATWVDQRFVAGELGTLRAVYNRYKSISEQIPTDEQILPIDLTKIRESALPVKTTYVRQLSDPVLLAGLISQYAFIRLFRIAADSFASEQASRLTAMDGATRNTEKMLNSMLDLERRERQGEITRQVLELVASRFSAG